MKNFEITKEFLDRVKGLLEEEDKKAIESFFKDIHFADIADIANNLPFEEAIKLIKNLPSYKIPKALTELDDALMSKVVEAFSVENLAKELTEMDTDDAADIIGELPVVLKKAVITAIDDHGHAEGIVELLRYEENSAGGLMAKELVSVREDSVVQDALEEIKKQAENVTKIHTIYVVDKHNKLKGRLSLKDFLSTPGKTVIKKISIPRVTSVSVNEKDEEVVKIMSKYDLESIPVVDELGKLAGRITIDDVIDVMKEQADKDYQLAAGITSDVEHSDSILKLSRARLPWLLIGTFGGLGAASIINGFSNIITAFPILIIFVPLIQSTGGNVGVQSSAIVVQSIAGNNMHNSILKRLLKEIFLSLINGGMITFLVLFIGHFFLDIPVKIALIVGIALIIVVLNSGLLGTFVPFFLNKRNIDPALATGPFITTGADILGILIYFFIAKMISGM